jgi:hypothetical protein
LIEQRPRELVSRSETRVFTLVISFSTVITLDVRDVNLSSICLSVLVFFPVFSSILDRRESILLNSVTKLFRTAVSSVLSPNNTLLVSPSICDVDSSFFLLGIRLQNHYNQLKYRYICIYEWIKCCPKRKKYWWMICSDPLYTIWYRLNWGSVRVCQDVKKEKDKDKKNELSTSHRYLVKLEAYYLEIIQNSQGS